MAGDHIDSDSPASPKSRQIREELAETSSITADIRDLRDKFQLYQTQFWNLVEGRTTPSPETLRDYAQAAVNYGFTAAHLEPKYAIPAKKWIFARVHDLNYTTHEDYESAVLENTWRDRISILDQGHAIFAVIGGDHSQQILNAAAAPFSKELKEAEENLKELMSNNEEHDFARRLLMQRITGCKQTIQAINDLASPQPPPPSS